MAESVWQRATRLLRRLTRWFAPDAAATTRTCIVHPASLGFTEGRPLRGPSQESEQERREICTELAEMEATALRQLAEAQENLEKIRALQRRAGCASLGLN